MGLIGRRDVRVWFPNLYGLRRDEMADAVNFALRLFQPRFMQGLQQTLHEPHDYSERRASRSRGTDVRGDGGAATAPVATGLGSIQAQHRASFRKYGSLIARTITRRDLDVQLLPK